MTALQTQHIPGVDWPWIRQIRVTFEGLKGSYGNKVFEADGTQSLARIAARVEQTINSVPNPTQIRIWNLAKETRSSFQRSETKIMIEAGWGNQGLTMVFKGSLLTAQSNRAGPDIVTTLHAVSGHDELVTTLANKVYSPKMRVDAVVRDLANMLNGVIIGPIKGFEKAVIGPGGWTISDDVRVSLDRLAREFGFSWTICNDVFQAIGDEKILSNGPILKSPYLIEANPILTGPRRYSRGASVKCPFNPSVRCGHTVTVKSEIEEQANSEHTVHWLAHNLDCHSPNSFTTEIVGYTRRSG